MSARDFLESFFDVDEDGIIIDPPSSPFHGEPIYIPYYWHKYKHTSEEPVTKIKTTLDERKLFPELEDREVIYIAEWPDGKIQETDEILI